MSETKRQATLINESYLKEYSILPKNYDLTEILNFIPISEQIHIIPIIGIPLYDELIEQVTNNNLTGENSTLLLEIYKVEGIAVVYEALPFIWSHVSQVGITKGFSNNSESIDNKDITYINTRIKAQLDYAKQNLVNWLEMYKKNFPLYKSSEVIKVQNDAKPFFTLNKDNIDIN